jgi:hypothetical protein
MQYAHAAILCKVLRWTATLTERLLSDGEVQWESAGQLSHVKLRDLLGVREHDCRTPTTILLECMSQHIEQIGQLIRATIRFTSASDVCHLSTQVQHMSNVEIESAMS